MKLPLLAFGIIFLSIAATASTAAAVDCNGTNILGTWHRQPAQSFTTEAVWTFVSDSVTEGTISCSGDCVRKAGRPVGWATPGDFWNEPGNIKIKFERTEIVMRCAVEGDNRMIWSSDGVTDMMFEKQR
jgi:hypothetical protein